MTVLRNKEFIGSSQSNPLTAIRFAADLSRWLRLRAATSLRGQRKYGVIGLRLRGAHWPCELRS